MCLWTILSLIISFIRRPDIKELASNRMSAALKLADEYTPIVYNYLLLASNRSAKFAPIDTARHELSL
jgi:hypothetical protein